jgi:hypothetical protein
MLINNIFLIFVRWEGEAIITKPVNVVSLLQQKLAAIAENVRTHISEPSGKSIAILPLQSA